VLNTIAFAGGNCADAYIGGHFSSANGTAVKDIAEIDTTTGTGFKSSASGVVQTIAAVGGHLLVGGNFTGINGDAADPYMVSLSPATGKSDGFVHLNISGNYQYAGSSRTHPRLQPADQPRRHPGPGRRRLHPGRRPGPPAGVHPRPERHHRHGDRLERARVHHQLLQHRAVLRP